MTTAASRTSADGGRRYRPVEFTFDARSHTLAEVVKASWDEDIAAQWRENQASMRTGLLAEYGALDGDRKIADFVALGPAPLSIVHEHNEYLSAVRSAFTHGDYYPALVGGCTLGERILNELLRALLPDFVNHPATTKRVRSGNPVTDWKAATSVLQGWNVVSMETSARFAQLQGIRHSTVHYTSSLAGKERDLALSAIHLVQSIIEDLFAGIGGPPRFIAGTAGVVFIALEAESDPLTKRIFLPRCVLVSPSHYWHMDLVADGAEVTIIDDADYPDAPLSDSEYAAAYPDDSASMASHLHSMGVIS